MLTAYTKSGTKICLGDGWDRRKLLHLRENNSFCCPLCNESLILKLGEKKIFHFAHKKDSICRLEHENESEYHLKGKLQLYNWLKTQDLKPELEYYDSSIMQRADILFQVKKQRFALEYQCSKINEELFCKRTLGYLSKGYTPIWILGSNQWNRKSTNLSSFSDFHYLFLQKFTSNIWMIPFYCSETQKFIIQQSIQPVSIRKAFSYQKITNISNMDIAQLFSPRFVNPIQPIQWIKELIYYKHQLISFSGSYQNSFLKTIYEHYLHLSLLPPYVGLPVANSVCIITPPLIWQTYLFIDVLYKRNIHSPIKLNEVFLAFKRRVDQKQILLRYLPLNKDERNLSFAILQYFQLLESTKIIRKLDEQTFMINSDIVVPETVPEQKTMERAFYNRFVKIIFNKSI